MNLIQIVPLFLAVLATNVVLSMPNMLQFLATNYKLSVVSIQVQMAN